MRDPGKLPNFVYIGPDKAGSSWLHAVLDLHPQVFLTPAKDLYFFDRFHERGPDWYAGQFRGSRAEHVLVGEVCPDYLASPEAPVRMGDLIPGARLVTTLRDPATRAFSSWLYMRKHGEGPSSFGAALDTFPELLEHGRYGAQLERFLKIFPREQLFIGLFDDLRENPQAFVDSLTDWCAMDRLELPNEDLQAKLPASKARVPALAWSVRRAAEFARSHDGARFVGVVKQSPLVHKFLYTPLGESAPAMSDLDRDRVRASLLDDAVHAEEITGLALRERWGWLDGSKGA